MIYSIDTFLSTLSLSPILACFTLDGKHIVTIDQKNCLEISKVPDLRVVKPSEELVIQDPDLTIYSGIKQVKPDLWVLICSQSDDEDPANYPRNIHLI